MKTKCPANCGKIFVSREFAEKHADKEHKDWRIPKAKGWVTPYGFADFTEPVTYNHALELMEIASKKFK